MTNETTEKEIRTRARELLEAGEAEVVIGLTEGTTPLTTRPILVTKAEDADRLVWNGHCTAGVARYVLEYIRDRRKARDFDAAKAKKVAVVAKAGDARALVTYIQENQFSRDDVYIIGVNCPAAMVDRRKVTRLVGPYHMAAARLDGDAVVVTTTDGAEEKFPLEDCRDDACAACIRREPPMADVTFGEAAPAPEGTDPYGRVAEHEGRTADERWAWIEEELGRCIRCYACRQVCPACYCEECFAEQRNPAWIGPATAPADLVAFHLVRTFHTAGRCVECGECERACPMDIPLRVLSQKLVRDVEEKFGYVAGLDPEAPPPLSTYQPDDSNEGFM
ncbi:MAG: 4Fe-4S dicluster domain-containing protein [Candidatus Zixiibacteriota bacterium]|jgi:coenzyme F420-reducing hydrogenase beta subunit